MSLESEITRMSGKLALRAEGVGQIIPIPGSELPLNAVHIGRLPLAPGGWNNGFKDDERTDLPKAGIGFIVSQSSTGHTEVHAATLEGYAVEALTVDEETGLPKWQSPRKPGDEIAVAADYGNLLRMKVGSRDWGDQDLLGNPGIRAGLVRVTKIATGDVRYFGLGAKFSGRADDWWVQRGVIEFMKIEEISQPPKFLP